MSKKDTLIKVQTIVTLKFEHGWKSLPNMSLESQFNLEKLCCSCKKGTDLGFKEAPKISFINFTLTIKYTNYIKYTKYTLTIKMKY